MVIYSSNNQDNWMQYSLYQINTNEEVKQSVIRFMQNLGIGLRDIEVTIDQKKVEADELPPFLDSKFKNIILQGNVDSITAKVIYDGFEIDLMQEESTGVKKLFSLFCPLGRYPVVCRSWRKSTLRNMFLFLFHYLEKVSSLSCGPVEIYDRSRYQQWRYDCDPEAIEKKMGKQR